MLNHPTLQSLKSMRLEGMAQAFTEQLELGHSSQLAFEERLALLVDREVTHRENKGFSRRLHTARLKQNATLEDLDFKHPRNLDAAMVRSLAGCGWIRQAPSRPAASAALIA